jgi:methyltransferase-like protein/SAM-dependent methyltransferase
MSTPSGTSAATPSPLSDPYPASHPDRLAVVATLLGLQPRSVERCRVLELGCVSGGNLLPMAESLPESTFVGIDPSADRIAEGQKAAADLSLNNVELRQKDFLDLDADLGRFDYILCHGLYSRVTPPLQDKILSICAKNLEPHGIAYVSYDTYPGWHLRSLLRDMMLYHTRSVADPQTRAVRSRAFLEFLARAVGQDATNPYSVLLRSDLERVRRLGDVYLFREYLQPHCEPLYFYQFIERLAGHGLRYLGEADLTSMAPRTFPPEVQQVLRQVSTSQVDLEQYMDFLRNRMFRQSLLCAQSLTPQYALRAEQMQAFHLASPARPVSPAPNLGALVPERFEGLDGIVATVQDPLVKAALLALGAVWPAALPFATMRSRARQLLGGYMLDDPDAVAGDYAQLGQGLLDGYVVSGDRLLQLSLHPPALAMRVSERPLVSPLTRRQAEAGPRVVNRRHVPVVLGEFERQLLRLLDGTRDQQALTEALAALATQGELVVHRQGQPILEPEEVRQTLRTTVASTLESMARSALLVG